MCARHYTSPTPKPFSCLSFVPGSKTNRRNALGLSRDDFPKGFVVPKSFPKGFSALNSSRQKARKFEALIKEADTSKYRDEVKTTEYKTE